MGRVARSRKGRNYESEGWLGGGKEGMRRMVSWREGGKRIHFYLQNDLPPRQNIFLHHWDVELLKPRYLKLTFKRNLS